jgi:hypothetical protein
MAKTTTTTAEMNPTAATAQTAGAATASSNGKHAPQEQPTALQRGADSFMSMAEILAGGEPEPKDKPTPKEAPAKPAAKETPAKPAPKAADQPDAPSPPEEPGTKPILGDEDEAKNDPEDEDEDGAEGGKDDKASLEAKLFKQREKRRAAEKQRDTEAAEKAQLKKQIEELRTKTATDAPVLGGYFASVKSDADFETLKNQWKAYDDFLDDNAQGFDAEDGTERTAEWVKKERRAVRDALDQIPEAKKFLATQTAKQAAATEKATQLYPFVQNSGKKHHDIALSLAQEFPELNTSPHRALLLGMLTTARVVELGEFSVVPKLKSQGNGPAAAPATAPAAAKPASSVPSPAPPAPRVMQQVPDTSNHEHARIIAGDMEAVEDWAMALVGD